MKRVLKLVFPVLVTFVLGFVLSGALASGFPDFVKEHESEFIVKILGVNKLVLMILLSILYGGFIIGLSWLLKRFLSQNVSAIVLISLSVIIPAILLMSVEPYIARDSVKYGVRQELNYILEMIGYTKFNLVVYLSFILPVSFSILGDRFIILEDETASAEM